MKWPPRPVNGRIPYVEGVEATTTLVIQTLSDLQTNPFNPSGLSLGDVTFKNRDTAEGRVRSALDRLRSIVYVERIRKISDAEDEEEGRAEYIVEFIDRETRQPSEVRING